MSNWTTITIDSLKAAGHGTIVDTAQTAGAGSVDPIAESIADAISRVRSACSAGNQLDVDPTKVPNSLKGLTIRIALFGLMERIGYALTEDQRDTRRNDNSWLLRINDNETRFEKPDNAAADSAEQTPAPAPRVNRRHRHFKGWDEDGI
jgi:hypothetical protein